MKAGIVEIPHLIVVTKADLGAAAERARIDVAGALSLATTGDWPLKTLAVSSRSGAGMDDLLTEIDAHRTHLAADGRLAISRHRQSEGWVRETLQERFGARGLARLASLGLDASLPVGAQPFERLRELNDILEKTR
jgi:LAO/AO transport system kinase